MNDCCGGWPGNEGANASLPFGTLGIAATQNLTTTYLGTFFTRAGVFSDPLQIANAGLGQIQVYRDGAYLLMFKGVTENQVGNCSSFVRFFNETTGLEIPDTVQEIFENGDNNDHDAVPTFIPVTLNAGDKIRCELRTNQNNNDDLSAEATWSVIALRGSTGAKGDPGGAVDEMLAVELPVNTTGFVPGSTTGKNVFLNNAQAAGTGQEIYDDGATFDITTALWTPKAGRYNITLTVPCDDVNDSNTAIAYLYNETQAKFVLAGSASLGETAGENTSVLADTLIVNGTDVFSFRVEMEGASSPNTDTIVLFGIASGFVGVRATAQRVQT